jgi:hypothetical protein
MSGGVTMVGFHPVGSHTTAGLGDDDGDAGTPGGPVAGTGDRTSDSASSFARPILRGS